MTSFNINASSQPLYDTFGFADFWQCDDWILWYNELLKVYSSDESDYIWSKAWLDGVSSVSGGNGTAPGSNYIIDSVPLDCRTFNTNFKAFLEKNPNLKSAVFSGISGLIVKPIGLGVDVVNGVITFGTNTVSGITSVSTILKYAIPITVIILFILLIVFSIKFSNKKLQNE